jgi:hypothetical protein
VAGMVSPVVFGYLIEKTGSYNVPFANFPASSTITINGMI